MQVSKWGNSLAVRLPKALVDQLELKEGDEVQLVVTDKQTLKVVRAMTREEALANLRKYRGTMPAGFKFNRDEAHERG